MNSSRESNKKNDTKFSQIIRSGYDIKLYGTDNNQLYSVQITAVSCCFLSLSSAIAILVSSFLSNKNFFRRSKTKRFVIYLALTDSLFNIIIILDHMQKIISKSHIYPKELCTFYAFMNIEFIFGQYILVCIIALNMFMVIFKKKDVNFGAFDWRILVITFGVPLITAIVIASLDALGPNISR